ncbi:MAG TPA: hypothetical protein VK208_19020 [Pyrinomonadaceae bacterium]|jgi:hypothetical protein|nr:hypothetical protein [Pyrinomonadaceae bacterium]
MSKKVWTRCATGLGLMISLAFTAFIGGTAVTAQNVQTGNWTATLVDDNAKLNLNFERGGEQGHKNQIGQTYDFSELSGLSREQVLSGGAVKFSLAREAGTIDCEGSFQNGKGSGTFTFTGSAAFVSAMKSRGFDFEKDLLSQNGRHRQDRLFTATALNVTTALADDLSSAGFGKLEVEDLCKAAIFKINSQFMREMKATGFPNLTMEDLVKARIFKIDADLVREASQLGLDKTSMESLVKMRIFKVTPAFIAEVRDEGLTNLSLEDLIKLRIFNIDSEFIRQAKAEGVPLEVERLVQKRVGSGRRHPI